MDLPLDLPWVQRLVQQWGRLLDLPLDLPLVQRLVQQWDLL